MTPEQGIDFLIQKTIDLHAENLRLYTENMQLRSILIQLANPDYYKHDGHHDNIWEGAIEFCTNEYVGTPWNFAKIGYIE